MTKKILADRLKKFDSSAVRAAFDLANKLPNPVDLSIGFPEDDTPRSIKRAGIRAIKENYTRYTPANGLPELRAAIAAKLLKENKIAVSDDQVTVIPGITTGILLIYLAILNPGDEVIVPDPFYPPYRDLAIMLDAKPVYADTFPTFQLTVALIEPLITKKTKAIIINSPNNPSGAVYDRRELRKIANLAKKHNIIIISDEIYEHFSYNHRHFSIGSIYRHTLTVNGFSKAFAMTGWRLGYIAGPLNVIEAINELQQYIVFSTSSISQRAGIVALNYKPKQLTRKYREKRDLIIGLLRKNFEIYGAEGAFYAFVKLPKGMRDMDFVNQAAKKGLIILPGSVFSNHKDYVRIAFGNTKDQLIKGAKIINELLASEKKVAKLKLSYLRR